MYQCVMVSLIFLVGVVIYVGYPRTEDVGQRMFDCKALLGKVVFAIVGYSNKIKCN